MCLWVIFLLIKKLKIIILNFSFQMAEGFLWYPYNLLTNTKVTYSDDVETTCIIT